MMCRRTCLCTDINGFGGRTRRISMNYTEITTCKNFIKLNEYLIKIDAIDAINVYDIEYEYKDAIFYIQLFLRGREYPLELKYDNITERDNDFENLAKKISII
jgi:hypothetical protein